MNELTRRFRIDNGLVSESVGRPRTPSDPEYLEASMRVPALVRRTESRLTTQEIRSSARTSGRIALAASRP